MIRYPLLSVLLLLTWLALNNSVQPLDVLAGALIGIAVPWAFGSLWPDDLRIRRPMQLVRLTLRFLGDVVMANLELARLVLGPESKVRSNFVWYPLTTRNPYAITTLAGIITLTPGTVSADVTADRRYLLIHAFHVSDEAELIATIRRRYEEPLEEIFPC